MTSIVDAREIFNALPIDNCELTSLCIIPSEKCSVQLLQSGDNEHGLKKCELQFNQIIDDSILITAEPWFGRICSHAAYSNSDYFENFLKEQWAYLPKRDEYVHFCLKLEHGKIDIIGKDFVFSTLRK